MGRGYWLSIMMLLFFPSEANYTSLTFYREAFFSGSGLKSNSGEIRSKLSFAVLSQKINKKHPFGSNKETLANLERKDDNKDTHSDR